MCREDLILYLKQYQRLDISINKKFEALEELNTAATRITPKYSQKVKGGSVYKAGNMLVKRMDLEKAILEEIDKLITLYYEIAALFDNVKDDYKRLILYYRYIHGYIFDQIAEELGYSSYHIQRLHRAALGEVLQIWTEQKKS